ncbi:hypothetical protein Bca52824_000934 [Brassica carinata]|uniref:Uncharacterized protein n=1 Tax=Brassica carinata TaxID=52824 RepID=A0A8X8B9B1_BRACI|nr:hypothetical protein Bca52824_000934 [Brassica carinata]
MTNASDMKDTKDRASRAFEALGKSIKARAGADSDAKQSEAAERERRLESGVAGFEQMVTQYQKQLRTLEVNNYSLTLHLKQALQNNNSIPGRYHLFLDKT